MVIYALVLRKFIFCPGLLPFTASDWSIWGSCEGILEFQVGPRSIPAGPTVASTSFTADSTQLFSGHKKPQGFEYLFLLPNFRVLTRHHYGSYKHMLL